MNRYILWSIILHVTVLLGGAAVAPMHGFFDSDQDHSVVISVGLVDMPSAPATKVIKAPHLRQPTPAGSEEVAIAPEPDLSKEKVAEKKPEPEKPKEEPKPKEDKPKEEKPGDANAKKPDSAAATLAQNDNATGTTGSISDGGGDDDVWGVETAPNVNPYHRRGFASIRSNWRNPAVGPVGRKCTIRFRVSRDGELSDIALEKSSGSELFDRSAIRAVQLTHAWEHFPRFWKEDEQIIHLEFEYRP